MLVSCVLGIIMQTLFLVTILTEYVFQGSIPQSIAHQQGILLNKRNMKDELYEEAKDLVIKKQFGSAAFLQRALRIGYFRAASLIDQLEEKGVLGEADGARPRKVLLNKN